MKTLEAIKVKITDGIYSGCIQTELYSYPKGELMAIIPPNQRQPRKDKKTIELNCLTYNLKFVTNL